MNQKPAMQPEQLEMLIREGDEIWSTFREREKDRFHLFIPSDQPGAYRALAQLTDRASSFVEFGSASGVITIMADLLGFEAYGIEHEPWLVDRSSDLAVQFNSGATFVEGTFVPPEFEEESELLPPDHWTPTSGAEAYEELGIGLDEFDLIYAYPWPGEEDWLREIVSRCGRPDSLLLTYDVSEGFRLYEGDGPGVTLAD
ncbi:MAG: hypothetical protein ACI8TQ_001608 [Planctomycetota bacterium]|jgi:hypothetical protein